MLNWDFWAAAVAAFAAAESNFSPKKKTTTMTIWRANPNTHTLSQYDSGWMNLP